MRSDGTSLSRFRYRTPASKPTSRGQVYTFDREKTSVKCVDLTPPHAPVVVCSWMKPGGRHLKLKNLKLKIRLQAHNSTRVMRWGESLRRTKGVKGEEIRGCFMWYLQIPCIDTPRHVFSTAGTPCKPLASDLESCKCTCPSSEVSEAKGIFSHPHQ